MERRISRRMFLKMGLGGLAAGVTALISGTAYATRVEPGWIEVTEVDIPLAGLPQECVGLTITQLSDFHLGPQVKVEQVRRSVEMANNLGGDLVVLTGDYVSRSAHYSERCAAELARLRAKHGVHAILGNHDFWTDAEVVTENLRAVGINLLRNQHQALNVGGARLWLLGIDDIWVWKDDLPAALAGLPSQERRILLVHNPDFAETMPEGEVDLVLAGHTHGGQVRLPLLGAPVHPSVYGPKYVAGLAYAGNTPVYTNRGIGLISPAVRFLCRPEITLIRLTRGPVGKAPTTTKIPGKGTNASRTDQG